MKWRFRKNYAVALFFHCFFSCVLYSDARNPFSVTNNTHSVLSEKELALLGIVQGQNGVRALVVHAGKTTVVGEGDMVNGSRIVRIDEKSLVVENGEMEEEIFLE